MFTISPSSSEGENSGIAWEVYAASWDCDATVVLEDGGRVYGCFEKLGEHPAYHRYWGTNHYIHWTDDGRWQRVERACGL